MINMIVPIAQADLLFLAPAAIGFITLFGRKKKEEKNDESKPNLSNPPLPPSPKESPESASDEGESPPSPETDDPSLSDLLKSLMSTIPTSQVGRENENYNPPVSPEFVPPRATPHSRPMVLVDGDKGKRLVEAENVALPETSRRSREAPEPQPTIVGTEDEEDHRPTFARVDSLAEEVKRLGEEVKKRLEEQAHVEKPLKAEKHGKVERENLHPEKGSRGFEHVFGVADTAFLSPGLILVNGPTGSGKTSLCLSLAAAYLQRGSPCILVTYDRSPGEARDRMRRVGCDPAVFESQFRLLVVDGFSRQSESFSLEPYYVERPLDLQSLNETLTRNTQLFIGEKTPILLDSLDSIVAGRSSKELSSGLRELVDGLKTTGATFLVTVDSEKVSKDLAGTLESLSDCIIDLAKNGENGGKLVVRKLHGSGTKPAAQAFEFDSANRLVFV